MSRVGHLARVGPLLLFATLLLTWLALHTEILFADGLRYIAQAHALDRGSGEDGIRKAVDHPIYPLAIVAAHRVLGGETPEDWQSAAQVASIVAGILVIVPLYLFTRELFGDGPAVPACLLFFALPMTGHVFADTLSESTFLLFWTWGLWAALWFLKTGWLGWLGVVVASSALAYFSRPEGLLLPAALVATIVLSPRWVMNGLRGSLAVVIGLCVGLALLVGPYVAMKGGLGTKPSIGRLLGTAPRSDAQAVERQRPLEPGQTTAKTYLLAGRAVVKAVAEAVTIPLAPFILVGLVFLRPGGESARGWTLIGVVTVASLLALVRLHATGGYCSARHAMILMLIAAPTAAFGISRLIALVPARLAPFTWSAALAAVVVCYGSDALAPLNEGMGCYRAAAQWLAAHSAEDSMIVDVTGWSQFYGGRGGYTFANLEAAAADPNARWVVAREAHLKGPWQYCERLRSLVDGLEPAQVFDGAAGGRPTRVYVFDRHERLSRHTEPAHQSLLR